MVTAPMRYPALVRWVHWSTAGLVLLAYLTTDAGEALEEGGGGGVNWHVVAGLGLLLLFLPRIAGYVLRARRGPAPAAPSGAAARIAAGAIHVALLLFVVVQPLLGVLTVWAEGHALPIPFTPLVLPPWVQLHGWGHTLEELHETVGNVFYAVIGLHVLAALWHQWVRRDGVLRRML